MLLKRRVGLAWVLLSALVSIVWGYSTALKPYGTTDFRAVYYATRCLLQNHNPYNVGELERVVRDENGERASESVKQHQAVVVCINLPATFLFVAPFAVLPFGIAKILWLALLTVALFFAAFTIWDLSESYSPKLSAVLICIVLANSEVLFVGGNTAGIAVCLCLIAVWCFISQRFALAGTVCMALSLAIKPHDCGFVWLYFALVGGTHRKRALQSLIVTCTLGIAALLWVSMVAPHWMQDLRANVTATSSTGGINDPGPSSIVGFNNPIPIIDMQSVVSVFRDDPRIYDSITYLVCGSLVLLWLIATFRSAYSTARAWLAIAAIVPVTLLITYHRPYDAKLLLLTVPACAMLWAEGGLIAWVAVLTTTAGIISTADIPMAILSILTSDLHFSTLSLSGKIATVLTGRPIPLILFLMGVFYLWTYIRHIPDKDRATNASRPDQNRLASPPLTSGSNELHSPAREHSATESGAVLGAR